MEYNIAKELAKYRKEKQNLPVLGSQLFLELPTTEG